MEEAPEKIYLYPSDKASGGYEDEWGDIPWSEDCIEYTRTDTFLRRAKEAFCKARCNGHPPRSTCTSLGTCKEYDNFVKLLKGE